MEAKCRTTPTFRFSLLLAISSRSDISEFDGLGIEILFNHECYLEGDSVLELTQVKSCHFANLVKTVNQRVAVYEKFAGSFGDVQIVFKECLNGLFFDIVKHSCVIKEK